MGQIIEFPGKKPHRKKRTDVLIEKLSSSNDHIDMGNIHFTCPNCKQQATFEFYNLIFRTMQFFCSGCGHGFKMTNPAFRSTPVKIENK